MSRAATRIAANLATALLAATAGAQSRALGTIELDHVRDLRLVDTDGDGRAELVLVREATGDRGAALLRFGLDENGNALPERDNALPERGNALGERGSIELDDPAHTLLSIGDLLPLPGVEVVAATPRRTEVLRWPADDGTATAPIVLSRSAKFGLRVDQPRLSPFALDLNDDGRLDLMLPSLEGVRPFLQEPPREDGLPAFRRMDEIRVPVRVELDEGSRGLDQELVGRVRVPQIDTADLDGDGRPDLLTDDGKKHAFHMQRSDGTFAEPRVVDLSQFVDSTPKAALDLGSTAVLSDEQLLQRGDVDGDGVPDYVIAHRRKIWTFLADGGGPQFRKARTQAVAEDVTAMRLLDLDEDGKADLLTARVQLPGVGDLLLGLVQSIDIDVRVVGYQSDGDGFAGKPKWRRTVTLRIPPILTLLGQQEELFERFASLIGRARVSTRAVFDGDDEEDLAVVLPDNTAVELFRNVPPAPRLGSREGARALRELVFEGEDPVFDIDRVFGILSGFIDEVGERMVGGRARAAQAPLRDPAQWRLTELEAADLDGAPGAELVVGYRSVTDPDRRAYDVIGWIGWR